MFWHYCVVCGIWAATIFHDGAQRCRHCHQRHMDKEIELKLRQHIDKSFYAEVKR